MCTKPLSGFACCKYRRRSWKQSYKANRTLENITSDGTIVKSKGEVIIYDKLLYYGIEFVYEPGVEITTVDGQKKYVHPDFMIFLKDGSVLYWEHLGMLLDDQYAEKFKLKLQSYVNSGIVPGINLILTSDGPSTKTNAYEIRQLIESYILPRARIVK